MHSNLSFAEELIPKEITINYTKMTTFHEIMNQILEEVRELLFQGSLTLWTVYMLSGKYYLIRQLTSFLQTFQQLGKPRRSYPPLMNQ